MSKGDFASWSRAVLDPVMPGMDETSPRARVLPFALMMLALAVQVTARYEFGFLNDTAWQGVHIVIGIGTCLAIMWAFHGREMLTRVRPRSWFIIACATGCFLLFWHAGRIDSYARWVQPSVDRSGSLAPVYGFMYFSSSSVLFRLLLPFGLAWALLKLRPGDLGLHGPSNPSRAAAGHLWPIYLALFVGVLPFVFHVAGTAPFLDKYPLGRAMVQDGNILLHHFLIHECFYVLVFVSGEAFWRGFISFGLERDFGLYGLAVMIVPYVTGHFGKPLPETLGAIVAGGLLGWLALKHRSVWLGVAVHYGVAITMDLLAIRGNGFTIDTP